MAYAIFFSFLILSILVAKPEYLSYSQIQNNSNTSNNVWTNERNNRNITITLNPEVPIIDQKTKIQFDIETLNDSSPVDRLTAKVTLTDHDGRLYKFENKIIPVINGKFSTEYIFPDVGQHRILLQLFKNTTPYTIGSFDIFIPHSVLQQPPDTNNNFFSQLFGIFLN